MTFHGNPSAPLQHTTSTLPYAPASASRPYLHPGKQDPGSTAPIAVLETKSGLDKCVTNEPSNSGLWTLAPREPAEAQIFGIISHDVIARGLPSNYDQNTKDFASLIITKIQTKSTSDLSTGLMKSWGNEEASMN